MIAFWLVFILRETLTLQIMRHTPCHVRQMDRQAADLAPSQYVTLWARGSASVRGRPDSMGTALSNKGVNSPTINLLAKGLLFTARETSKDQAAENMQTLKGE